MPLTPTGIADIVHGRLHRHQKELKFYKCPCTVPEFIDWNRDILNNIAKYLLDQYNLSGNNMAVKRCIKFGILYYLVAEGVYAGELVYLEIKPHTPI